MPLAVLDRPILLTINAAESPGSLSAAQTSTLKDVLTDLPALPAIQPSPAQPSPAHKTDAASNLQIAAETAVYHAQDQKHLEQVPEPG